MRYFLMALTIAPGARGTASPPPPPSPSPPPFPPPRFPPGKLENAKPVKFRDEVQIANQPEGEASSAAVPARFETPEFIGAMCGVSVALCLALCLGYQLLLIYFGRPSDLDRCLVSDPRIAPHPIRSRRELWLAEQRLKDARTAAAAVPTPESAERLSPEAQAALLRYMGDMLRDTELPPPPTGRASPSADSERSEPSTQLSVLQPTSAARMNERSR